ncbi:hypothetical protein PAXRUDRAFT_835917 [Paxillus rubicundulus Ve08.2h10]|uniref:Uncharacterized protein n=1 Tax=Paxillus rubicundulus Ve08.2h10 TaxID=930991 RepID=A0A0D0CUA9_9AGAM|nr:hypothetical protein PAXRUDRAFT_835917 [Paxillus rubicundulus Ve08.2h10]
MMSMTRTTAPVFTGLRSMNKKGETSGIFVRSVPSGALVIVRAKNDWTNLKCEVDT